MFYLVSTEKIIYSKNRKDKIMSDIETIDKLLKPADLARRWGVSVKHLANLRSSNKGPRYIKPIGKVMYRLDDIIEYENKSVK